VRRGIVTLVWVAAALAVVGLWIAARDLTDRPPPSVETAPRQPPRSGLSGDGWTVVRQTSAHYMLVIEVETERVADAGRIAQQLTEPAKDRYTEILVYVFRPGRRGGLPAVRVQWTHRGGYNTTEYAPE